VSQLPLLLTEVTVVFAVTLLGAHLASKARASVRHLLLASAFGVALILPVATLVSPKITVEIAALPARDPEPVAANPIVLPPAAPAGSTIPDIGTRPVLSAPPPSSPAESVSIARWLLLAWGIVALVALLPVVASLIHLRSIRRRGIPWPEGAARLAQLAHLPRRRLPAVLQDQGIAAPVTGGLVQPVIAVPADAGTWSDAHLANALLHELEHVRRNDWAVHLATRAVCALYWFHPLAWIAWRALRLEAEHACDDAVLAREDAVAYADQLLALARGLKERAAQPGIPMVSGGDLSSRVRAVLDSTLPRGRAGKLVMACIVITAAIAIATLATLRTVGPTRVASGIVAVNPAATPAAPSAGPEHLYLGGQRLSVEAGGLSSDQASTVTSARVCVVTSGECFVAPEYYGSNPQAELVELTPGKSALLFRATASASGSGSSTTLSMLDLKEGRFINLTPDMQLSEQSEYALWREAGISDAPLLVTADYVAGTGETRFSRHRFRVRTFVLDTVRATPALREYVLRSEFVTVRHYPSLDEVSKIDVLSHEKVHALARLWAASGVPAAIAAIDAVLATTERDASRYRRTEHSADDYAAENGLLIGLHDGSSLRKVSAYLQGHNGKLTQHVYFSADQPVFVASTYEEFETKSSVEHRAYLNAGRPIRRLLTESGPGASDGIREWDPLPELLGRVKEFAACAAFATTSCVYGVGAVDASKVAFAYTDESGTRLLALADDNVTLNATNAGMLVAAVCAEGQVLPVRYLRMQQRSSASNGRQGAGNFANEGGPLFEILTGRAGASDTCMLVPEKYLKVYPAAPNEFPKAERESRESAYWRAVGAAERRQQPVDLSSFHAPTDFARSNLGVIEKAKKRAVKLYWPLYRSQPEPEVAAVEFAADGDSLLGSLVFVVSGGISFLDMPASIEKGRKDGGCWRVDDDCRFGAAGMNVQAVLGRAGRQLVFITLGGAEGKVILLLQPKDGVLVELKRAYRYQAPI
jgi:beta-lactamase regulating signal transducer with metallopeptidase domain